MKKKAKKSIVGVLLFLIVATLVLFIWVNHISNKGVPEYSGEVKLKNLKEKVVIRRDAHAIPLIEAENEEDLYRATGFALAQDRLWQMDLLRRVTMGRLSEIFGEDLIDADHLLRALKIPDKSKMVLEKTDKEIINALEAFADGVNQYIELNLDKLPPEFTILGYEPEPWKIEHSVNLIGYMAWDLTMAWTAEVTLHKIMHKVDSAKFVQLIPDMGNHKTYTFTQGLIDSSEIKIKKELSKVNHKLAELGVGVFEGSNNWAVSGKKSTTGAPILANDMHLGLFAPGIWYQAHQYIDGKLNVTGLVLPGAPFVIDGHNDDIAWGMTNIMIDDMDFYLEKLNPEDSNQYLLNGLWKDLEVRKEKIVTKDGDTIEKVIRFTHRGPIISGFKTIDDKAISMRWTGNDYSNELRSVYLLNRAKNWTDFKEALKTFNSLGQNVVYADRNGNIGLWSATNIPIRKGQPWLIYPGDTTEFDWQGYVPFDSLPHEYNPKRGYVASANCNTAPPEYPHYISKWFDLPYRMDRIQEMLEEKEKLSIDDFKSIQGDHSSNLTVEMKDGISKSLEKIKELQDWQQKGLKTFNEWDGIHDVDSKGASIFEYFYSCFTYNLIYDEIGSELYNEFIADKILVRNLVQNLWTKPESSWYDNIITKDKKENFDSIIHKSFIGALDSLKSRLGKNPKNWNWGYLHTLTLKHPLGKVALLDFGFKLNKGPYPVGGSFHTVSPYSYDYENLFEVNHGASHRHIYSVADWDKSLTIIPTGISGVPSSPYYCDQTEKYLKNEFHADYFDIMKAGKNSKYRMTLIPN